MKSIAATHELTSGPILTSRNPINPKGNQAIPPLPSKLPELITSLKSQIAKTPEGESETLAALWSKLGEYETQKFGAPVTKRTPARQLAKTVTPLQSFTPSPELAAQFRRDAQAAIEQPTVE